MNRNPKEKPCRLYLRVSPETEAVALKLCNDIYAEIIDTPKQKMPTQK